MGNVTCNMLLGTRSDGQRTASVEIWAGTYLFRISDPAQVQAFLAWMEETPQSYWHDLAQQTHAHLTFADLPTPEGLFASPEEEVAELRAWTKVGKKSSAPPRDPDPSTSTPTRP